jgi:hypothetical protein
VCKFKLLKEAGFSDCTLDQSANATFFYFAGGLNTAAPVKTATTATATKMVTDAVGMETIHIGTWAVLSASEPTQHTPSME